MDNGISIHCAQHNEHALHANARESEVPEKMGVLRLNLASSEHKSLTYCYSLLAIHCKHIYSQYTYNKAMYIATYCS